MLGLIAVTMMLAADAPDPASSDRGALYTALASVAGTLIATCAALLLRRRGAAPGDEDVVAADQRLETNFEAYLKGEVADLKSKLDEALADNRNLLQRLHDVEDDRDRLTRRVGALEARLGLGGTT